MRPPVTGQHFFITFGEAGVVTLWSAKEGPVHIFYREQLADLESVAFEANLRCQLETALKESIKSLKETGSAFPEREE